MPVEYSVDNSVFLELDFVTRCIEHLRSRKIHRHFPGYLCVCYTATLEGRREKLKPGFKSFFERFLLVGDPPEGTPYLVPFHESGNPESNAWLNGNVAGSYAPSSLRPEAPFLRTAEFFNSGRAASLSMRDEHEEACLQHLLFGNAVNAVALAGFLLRDHGFIIADGYTPNVTDLVNEMYSLFGFGPGGFSRIIFTDDEQFDFEQVWAPTLTKTGESPK